MASAALFDLLPDFGANPPRVRPPAVERAPAQQQPEPQVDIDAVVARAVAEAEAALEARLAGQHAQELETERRQNADEARAFMESFGEDLGNAVAERIEAMQANVTELVGAAVTRIVGTLLGNDLRERSLAALARSIRDSVGDADAVRIHVRGPQTMADTLRTALGPLAEQLDFAEAPGFDLTVTIDEAVFETRMAEWANALAEVLP